MGSYSAFKSSVGLEVIDQQMPSLYIKAGYMMGAEAAPNELA